MNPEPSNTDVLVLSWNRPQNVCKIVARYRDMSKDFRIHVWDNADSPVLRAELLQYDNVTLIQSSMNFGTRARLVYPLLLTRDFILSQDDDLLLDVGDVEKLFRAYATSPDVIWGVAGRCVDTSGNYVFEDRSGSVDIVLGKVHLYKRLQLQQHVHEMFSASANLREDDIAMSLTLPGDHRVIPLRFQDLGNDDEWAMYRQAGHAESRFEATRERGRWKRETTYAARNLGVNRYKRFWEVELFRQGSTELTDLALEFGSDKGNYPHTPQRFPWKYHSYTDYYSELFRGRRLQIRRILELGIGSVNLGVPSNMTGVGTPGASLRMWKAFFPFANVFGCDIDPATLFGEDRIRCETVDQTSANSVANLLEVWPYRFDIIVDDGLHGFEPSRCFFEMVHASLADNGIYVIEDVVSSDLQAWADYLVEVGLNFDLVRLRDQPMYDDNTFNNLVVVWAG